MSSTLEHLQRFGAAEEGSLALSFRPPESWDISSRLKHARGIDGECKMWYIPASLGSLTAIVAPVVSTGVFSFFTAPDAPVRQPGAPFFMGSVLFVLAGLLAFGLPQHVSSTPATPSPDGPVPG